LSSVRFMVCLLGSGWVKKKLGGASVHAARRAGEVAAARRAMQTHLQNSHDRFAAVLEESPPARRAA
jgi:hypothetical protein